MFTKEKKAVSLVNTLAWPESAKRNGPLKKGLEEQGRDISHRLLTHSLLPWGAFSAMLDMTKIAKIMSQDLLTQGDLLGPY